MVALDGEGMFTLRNAQGQTRYTRAGEFQFDAAGVLVDRNDSSKVMAMDASGKLAELSLQGLQVGAAQATSVAHFTGNLSSTTTDQTVGAIKVFDTETLFQVDAKLAEKFAAMVSERKKGGVRIMPAQDQTGISRARQSEPQTSAEDAPAAPEGPRKEGGFHQRKFGDKKKFGGKKFDNKRFDKKKPGGYPPKRRKPGNKPDHG